MHMGGGAQQLIGWVTMKNKEGNTGDFMKKVPTATCALRDR